jgi:hypothetical protein
MVALAAPASDLSRALRPMASIRVTARRRTVAARGMIARARDIGA